MKAAIINKDVMTFIKTTLRSLLDTTISAARYVLFGAILLQGTGFAFHHYFPRVSSINRIKSLPLLGDVERRSPALYKGVVILTDDKGAGFCSGSVIDNNYIVTAAHCLVDGEGRLNKGHLQVRDITGKLIDVKAQAAAANTRVDVGIVIGDFRTFEFIPVDYKRLFNLTGDSEEVIDMKKALGIATTEVVSCGYPEAQATLTCVPVTEVRYENFQITGKGQLFPGMSGGPVFIMTETGPVMFAVNTAMGYEGGRNEVLLSPVLGLQGEFDLY